jgi:hypothetical protein
MPKKIPYGQSNFESIMTENYAFVDKTRFIEFLEKEPTKFHFLIRPRKFGKSLFLSVLQHYYDTGKADLFDTLFGNLYIGKNPTPKRSSMLVLRFSFAGIDTTSIEDFQISFTESTMLAVQRFFVEHRNVIENYEELEKEVSTLGKVSSYLEYVIKVVEKMGRKLYVIIDEYDHFANDLIALGSPLSNEQYKQTIWANSIVRDFYETLKDATQSVVDKIFITGITPIMLDDLTSGFNVSDNISVKEKYNEILGFTRDEVEWFIDETGVSRDDIVIDIERFYDGYLFHPDAKNKLYNSTMISYYLMCVLDEGKRVRYLIDDNLKTDYSRIKMLLNKPSNIEILKKLIENGFIRGEIVPKFSINDIYKKHIFLSLLYYLGLVTIDVNDRGDILKIPNYSIKTMYWNYIERMCEEESPDIYYDPSKIYDAVSTLARDNTPALFFDFIKDNILSRLSNRDFIGFGEKDLKILILGILFQTSYYLPVSEHENSGGYTDIYLKRGNRYDNIVFEWVWEIKYIPERDIRKKAIITQKKKDALEQLRRYKASAEFAGRADVRYLSVIFYGGKRYETVEV